MQEHSGNLSGDMRSFSSTSSFKHVFMDSDISTIKSYIQDLKSSLKINKELVESLLLGNKPVKGLNLLRPAYFSPKAIESLFHANTKLDQEIDSVHDLTSETNTKNFLNEQIFDDWQMRHNELVDDYKEQLNELLFQDERKTRVIEDLTEINTVLTLEAEIAKKSKYVFSVKPNSEILDFHYKIEKIREYVQFRARDIYSYEIQKKSVSQACEKIKNGIHKIKTLVRNPLNRKSNLEKIQMFIGNEIDEQKTIPQLDLSLIEAKNYNALTARTPGEENLEVIENDIEIIKREIYKESQKLVRISEKNQKVKSENESLVKEHLGLRDKVEELHRVYYSSDLTVEVIDNYHNSVPYKVKSGYLEEISEIEVNPENFYEISEEDP